MKFTSIAKLLTLSGIMLSVVVGCATAPTQEMSDARQAIQSAREAGADRYAPAGLQSAEGLLSQAEQSIEKGLYDSAREDAIAAKKQALSARNMALAIGSAEAALDQADKLGFEWRDSHEILAKARAAADDGDEATAVKYANVAKRQGEDAVAQYYLETAKVLLWDAEGIKDGMSTGQRARYQEAYDAYRNGEGRRAYDLISQLLAELETQKPERYLVERGDSLWRISGKSQIYGNPYQWPLIYKANASQIKDADLIYPGQGFSILRNYSQDEVDTAVRHARTRGAWSLGTVEASDRAYLNQLRIE